MSSDIPRSVRTLFIDEGRVAVDSRAPLSSYWITRNTWISLNAELTGQDDPARDEEARVEDLPCGVLVRDSDGSEVLVSVDGVRLELDGRGGVRVPAYEGWPVPHAGVYMVIDDLPPDAPAEG